MQEIVVAPGEMVTAAIEGHQTFVSGGAGSAIALNGNPADYALHRLDPPEDGQPHAVALIALNGTGEYRFAATIEWVRFVSGAYCRLRNLPAVIAGGDRGTVRRATTERFVSHAQIREDVLLMRALRHVDPATGFYVDIGAYDPDEDSITRLFYDRGWRGINVEPSPTHHDLLRQRRPRDINLCAAASSRPGRMRFFRNDGEQLGTLEARFADADAGAVEVDVIRMADICREHVTGEIHFLKIDVEGHERNALEGWDFAAHRPWIVIIEAVAPNRADIATYGEWEDILLDAGYHLAGEDELNRYYLAEEHRDLAHCFALPVDHFVAARDLAERDALATLVAELRDKVRALESVPAKRRSLLRRWLG